MNKQNKLFENYKQENPMLAINKGDTIFHPIYDYKNINIKNHSESKSSAIHKSTTWNRNIALFDLLNDDINTYYVGVKYQEGDTQFGISETCEDFGLSINDREITSKDPNIQKEQIKKTGIRGLIEECCININKNDLQVNSRNWDFSNNGYAYYNASLKITENTNIDYKYNSTEQNQLKFKTQIRGQICIKIFGQKDVLINKIQSLFSNNPFLPNDSIDALFLIPHCWLKELFSSMFEPPPLYVIKEDKYGNKKKYDLICKFYDAKTGCLHKNCKFIHTKQSVFMDPYNKLLNNNHHTIDKIIII